MAVKAKYGGRKIAELVNMAKETAVIVGVLKGAGEHPNATGGQTMALIAAWNEFGNRRIPSRPFLRTTLREHRYYKDEMQRIMKSGLKGGQMVPRFKLLGIRAASDIQNKITTNSFTPNAASTILKKSTSAGVKDKPLIDTGALRQSIQSTVEVRQ